MTTPPANDGDTEPGIGVSPEMVRLRHENKRLRTERDAALAELERTSSVPPPPTRRQKAVGVSLALGKYAVLLPALVLAARAAQKQWPEFAGLIDAVFGAFGLL